MEGNNASFKLAVQEPSDVAADLMGGPLDMDKNMTALLMPCEKGPIAEETSLTIMEPSLSPSEESLNEVDNSTEPTADYTSDNEPGEPGTDNCESHVTEMDAVSLLSETPEAVEASEASQAEEETVSPVVRSFRIQNLNLEDRFEILVPVNGDQGTDNNPEEPLQQQNSAFGYNDEYQKYQSRSTNFWDQPTEDDDQPTEYDDRPTEDDEYAQHEYDEEDLEEQEPFNVFEGDDYINLGQNIEFVYQDYDEEMAREMNSEMDKESEDVEDDQNTENESDAVDEEQENENDEDDEDNEVDEVDEADEADEADEDDEDDDSPSKWEDIETVTDDDWVKGMLENKTMDPFSNAELLPLHVRNPINRLKVVPSKIFESENEPGWEDISITVSTGDIEGNGVGRPDVVVDYYLITEVGSDEENPQPQTELDDQPQVQLESQPAIEIKTNTSTSLKLFEELENLDEFDEDTDQDTDEEVGDSEEELDDNGNEATYDVNGECEEEDVIEESANEENASEDNVEKEIVKEDIGEEVMGKEDNGKEEHVEKAIFKKVIGKDIIGKDNMVKDNIVKDNFVQDNFVQDNIVKDKNVKDNIDKDNNVKDNILKDNIVMENIGKKDIVKEEQKVEKKETPDTPVETATIKEPTIEVEIKIEAAIKKDHDALDKAVDW